MIALVQRVAAGPLGLDRGVVNQVERHVDHVTVDLHPLGRGKRPGGQVEPPVAAVAGVEVTQVAFIGAVVQRGGGGAVIAGPPSAHLRDFDKSAKISVAPAIPVGKVMRSPGPGAIQGGGSGN